MKSMLLCISRVFFVIRDSFGVIRVKFQRIGVKCNSVLKINQTNNVIIIHSAYLGSGASKFSFLELKMDIIYD